MATVTILKITETVAVLKFVGQGVSTVLLDADLTMSKETSRGSVTRIDEASLVGGTGYTNGTHTNVPTTGGTGTGLTVDITVVGGIVTSIAINTPGVAYVAGDAGLVIGGTHTVDATFDILFVKIVIPIVNIIGMYWMGDAGATINITRAIESILDICADRSAEFKTSIDGNAPGYPYVDTIENDEDIVVTQAVADSVLYLILRKSEGYQTRATVDQLGSYGTEAN